MAPLFAQNPDDDALVVIGAADTEAVLLGKAAAVPVLITVA